MYPQGGEAVWLTATASLPLFVAVSLRFERCLALCPVALRRNLFPCKARNNSHLYYDGGDRLGVPTLH